MRKEKISTAASVKDCKQQGGGGGAEDFRGEGSQIFRAKKGGI